MGLIICTAVVAILYAIISIFPQWKDSHHKWALVWSSVLGIALAVLGIFVGIDSQKSSQSTTDTLNINLQESRRISSRQLQDSIETQKLKSLVDSQSTRLEKQLLLIDNLRIENTDLNSKLSKSTKEIYDHLTGGDSYLTASIHYAGSLDKTGKIALSNEGKYPIPFSVVICTDLNIKDSRERFDKAIIFNPTNLFGSTYTITNYEVVLDKVNGINLQFQFDYGSPHRMSFHQLRMLYVDNRWMRASRTTVDGKTFYKIDPKFPQQDPEKIFGIM